MEPLLDINSNEDLTALKRLHRLKTVEVEMMRDRGCILEQCYAFCYDPSAKDFGFPNFDAKQFLPGHPLYDFNNFLKMRAKTGLFKSRPEFSAIYPDSSNPTQYRQNIVILYLPSAYGKPVVMDNIAVFKKMTAPPLSFTRFVLVAEWGIHSGAHNSICKDTAGREIQIYKDIELSFNPTKHALAPIEAKLIKSNDVLEWANDEEISSNKLPFLMDDDTIAKWFGAKVGDCMQYSILCANVDKKIKYRTVKKVPSDIERSR